MYYLKNLFLIGEPVIILDYSQVALAAIFMLEKDLKSDDIEGNKNLIRHAILSSILSNKKKFQGEYGSDVVIACDGFNYWRKDEFVHYKAGRKKAREDSNLDWKFIFDVMGQIREDLKENFPYKIIRVDRAEADDVIASIAKWTQSNDLSTTGIEEIPKKTLIISSDGDFKQLHKFSNIRQYSPMFKKYVEKPKNVQEFIYTHIAKGDRGDGIPSILNPDDCFVEGIRQKAMSSVRLGEFIKFGVDSCKNDTEKRNWHRNEKLISFEKIPTDIEDAIIAVFNEPANTNKNRIFKYLIDNQMRLLLNDIDSF